MLRRPRAGTTKNLHDSHDADFNYVKIIQNNASFYRNESESDIERGWLGCDSFHHHQRYHEGQGRRCAAETTSSI